MKNRFFILIVVFFVVAAPSVALGNAAQLLEKCKVAIVATTDPSELENMGFTSGVDIGFCLGYLRGISDYALGAAQLDPDSLKEIKSCRPPSVDDEQLARVVIKF